MSQSKPSVSSVLSVLTKSRLGDLGREIGLTIPADETKDVYTKVLQETPVLTLHYLLSFLGRDELRAACRAHHLDDAGRAGCAVAKTSAIRVRAWEAVL
jgi:hypothetical protein